jgi:maltose O-acetyltransferase
MRHVIANMLLSCMPTTRLFAVKRIALIVLGYKIGLRTRICGRVRIHGNGSLSIGNDSWIGIGCEFFITPEAGVTIGDQCDIAPHVHFITGTHDMGGPERRAGTGRSLPIMISDGTWIGTRSTILPGAVVGAASMVAAGAVVPGKCYPEHALLAGVPAVVKKSLNDGG